MGFSGNGKVTAPVVFVGYGVSAPDADYEDPGLHAGWLRDALDAVLEGATPARAQTRPVGCSIKWKS